MLQQVSEWRSLLTLPQYTLLEQNNSSLFCQATKLNSERVRRKLSNGFLLALFCVLLRKNYHNIFTSPNGEDTIILSARLLCR